VSQKGSSISRFISEVRLGMRPSETSDSLEWPGDEPRTTNIVEKVEEVLSMAFFTVMFISVLAGVFWRYVLDDPLIWTANLAIIAFICSVLIGAGLPNWADEHIQFDLLYKRMSPRWQRVARMVGNLLLAVTFALPIPATWDYLMFVTADSVTGLPLNFGVAFAVVLWFLVATVLHRGRLLLKDVRAIVRERSGRAEHA
jgi:TRAP-type C4-dicarboxylate transport system permease small subunit